MTCVLCLMHDSSEVVGRHCRLATSVAKPETQVVTHLCYSDFEDILPAIDGLKGAPLRTQTSTTLLPRGVGSHAGQHAQTSLQA